MSEVIKIMVEVAFPKGHPRHSYCIIKEFLVPDQNHLKIVKAFVDDSQGQACIISQHSWPIMDADTAILDLTTLMETMAMAKV